MKTALKQAVEIMDLSLDRRFMAFHGFGRGIRDNLILSSTKPIEVTDQILIKLINKSLEEYFTKTGGIERINEIWGIENMLNYDIYSKGSYPADHEFNQTIFNREIVSEVYSFLAEIFDYKQVDLSCNTEQFYLGPASEAHLDSIDETAKRREGDKLIVAICQSIQDLESDNPVIELRELEKNMGGETILECCRNRYLTPVWVGDIVKNYPQIKNEVGKYLEDTSTNPGVKRKMVLKTLEYMKCILVEKIPDLVLHRVEKFGNRMEEELIKLRDEGKVIKIGESWTLPKTYLAERNKVYQRFVGIGRNLIRDSEVQDFHSNEEKFENFVYEKVIMDLYKIGYIVNAETKQQIGTYVKKREGYIPINLPPKYPTLKLNEVAGGKTNLEHARKQILSTNDLNCFGHVGDLRWKNHDFMGLKYVGYLTKMVKQIEEKFEEKIGKKGYDLFKKKNYIEMQRAGLNFSEYVNLFIDVIAEVAKQTS
jgi:hypothetical protein